VLLVAGGAAYRAFGKELPAETSSGHGVTAYFIVLLAILTYLSTLAPLGVPPR
jgi:hypothetical protein